MKNLIGKEVSLTPLSYEDALDASFTPAAAHSLAKLIDAVDDFILTHNEYAESDRVRICEQAISMMSSFRATHDIKRLTLHDRRDSIAELTAFIETFKSQGL